MADGAYERRIKREMELKRFARIISNVRKNLKPNDVPRQNGAAEKTPENG